MSFQQALMQRSTPRMYAQPQALRASTQMVPTDSGNGFNTGDIASGYPTSIFPDSRGNPGQGIDISLTDSGSSSDYTPGAYSINKSAYRLNGPIDSSSFFYDRANQAANRNIFNPANQNAVRDQQMSFANALQQQALGQGGPTAAQAQLRMGNEANLNALMSMAATNRGMNPGSNQRNLMNALSQANAQTGQQAAMLRAQDQLSAQSQLGNLMNQTRAGDMDLGQMLINQQAQNDAVVADYMRGGLSFDEANRQAQIDLENQRADIYRIQESGRAGLALQASANANATKNAWIGGGLSAAGAIIGSSMTGRR